MKEVEKEVLKSKLGLYMLYLITHGLVHVVPKKGVTLIKNEKNELISTRIIIRWQVCIYYRKLKKTTRKYHYPTPSLLGSYVG